MAQPRFHVPGEIREGREIRLPDGAAHHLNRVLRLREGAGVTLFNGEGGEYHCTITAATRKEVLVLPATFRDINRTPESSIQLGMCVLKREPMDSVLTRVTELGVSSITPLISEHCTVSPRVIRDRHRHWQQVIIAACEQSGLNIIPPCHPATQLTEWIMNLPPSGRLVALPGGQLMDSTGPGNEFSLLVGPEGGFSEKEKKTIHGSGFSAMDLGNRILRAETAPVVAMSVIEHLARLQVRS